MAVLANGRPRADGRAEPSLRAIRAGKAALRDYALREGNVAAVRRARQASRGPRIRRRQLFDCRHRLLSLGGAVRAAGPEARGFPPRQALVRSDQGAARDHSRLRARQGIQCEADSPRRRIQAHPVWAGGVHGAPAGLKSRDVRSNPLRNSKAIVATLVVVLTIGLLAGTVLQLQYLAEFLRESEKAQGVVVNWIMTRSGSSGGVSGTASYFPVVYFTDRRTGHGFEFRSSVSGNPSDWLGGKTVEVLYRRSDPNDAKINDFFNIWALPLITGVPGGIFFLILAAASISWLRKRWRDNYLRKSGTAIEANFQGVERIKAGTDSEVDSFRVVAIWEDPQNYRIYTFKSDKVWS